MNGEDLLRGMSHVEERFIEEAQATPAVRKTPWLRIAALAACFAFVIVCGGFWLVDLGMKGNAENSLRADAVETEKIGIPEIGEDIAMEDDSQFLMTAAQPDVLVRIEGWQENSFTAIVLEPDSANVFSEGTQVTVIFREDIRLIQVAGELISCTLRQPTEKDFPEGALVKVWIDNWEETVIYTNQIGTADVS